MEKEDTESKSQSDQEMSELGAAQTKTKHDKGGQIEKAGSSRLAELQKGIKAWAEWMRIIFLVVLFIFLFAGIVYNLFAPSEKDIPEEVFKRLYSFLQAHAADSPKLLPLSDYSSSKEWAVKNNLTKL